MMLRAIIIGLPLVLLVQSPSEVRGRINLEDLSRDKSVLRRARSIRTIPDVQVVANRTGKPQRQSNAQVTTPVPKTDPTIAESPELTSLSTKPQAPEPVALTTTAPIPGPVAPAMPIHRSANPRTGNNHYLSLLNRILSPRRSQPKTARPIWLYTPKPRESTGPPVTNPRQTWTTSTRRDLGRTPPPMYPVNTRKPNPTRRPDPQITPYPPSPVFKECPDYPKIIPLIDGLYRHDPKALYDAVRYWFPGLFKNGNTTSKSPGRGHSWAHDGDIHCPTIRKVIRAQETMENAFGQNRTVVSFSEINMFQFIHEGTCADQSIHRCSGICHQQTSLVYLLVWEKEQLSFDPFLVPSYCACTNVIL